MDSGETRRAAFAALRAEVSARSAPGRCARRLVPLEIPSIDRLLGGGFPCGSLVALEGTAGRWSIAARLTAVVTARAMAAIVDDGALYPPALARAGVRLDRVLVVPARTPLGIARAADTLLRSRACRLIVISAPVLRPAVWLRLATLAQRTGALLVAILAPHDVRGAGVLSAIAGVRLVCARERLAIAGRRGLWCSFVGYDVRVEVCKAPSSAGSAGCLRASEPLDGVTLRERIVASHERSARAALR